MIKAAEKRRSHPAILLRACYAMSGTTEAVAFTYAAMHARAGDDGGRAARGRRRSASIYADDAVTYGSNAA
eukprot:1841873-Rhodomonas_salina.1